MQGTSLDCAVMSLGKDVFTKGMSYVALSRVTTLEGLALLSFDPDKVKPDPKVLKEYVALKSKAKKKKKE